MIEFQFARIRRHARRLDALHRAGKVDEARLASLALGPEDQARVFAVMIAERAGESVTPERIEAMAHVIVDVTAANVDAPVDETWAKIFDEISSMKGA